MYYVRVEADFAAAHFLSHYHGKCERLHGHNYRVRAWARGAGLGDGGMVLDFGELKGAL
nr:6-carboxytetrahydropterin synthase [Treponema sp.]